ncbi:hypothetical protein HDF16_006295 [Granulicella aggregans]|uniref:Uncharacterized protein n=1 Tax=Granulicella aggregans TaxID=474949 RepID=A0A7W7ZL52_9BACT|nr:hypothetical protein [Granulicella aggregans]MBB5061559.1 hypothetical protein [Granulicella aggregans]
MPSLMLLADQALWRSLWDKLSGIEMDLQTDIDGIRAKVATLEAARDRTTVAGVKAEIQAEIDQWILIHAHVLLSTRFASPEKALEDLAPEKPVASPRTDPVHQVSSVKRWIVIAFTLGVIVGTVALWLLLRVK